jgi:hypothetical protein
MPLTYPIRLEVQRRLSALLSTIAIANGYHQDVGPNVFRGRGVFGDETPTPSLSILEVPIPLDQLPPPVGSPLSAGGWEMVVQGWVADDKKNPTDPAHVLLADVKQCLAGEMSKTNWDKPEDGILGLGRSVTKLYIGAGVVRPPEEVSSKAYFWLTITLDLAEDLEHPYDE